MPAMGGGVDVGAGPVGLAVWRGVNVAQAWMGRQSLVFLLLRLYYLLVNSYSSVFETTEAVLSDDWKQVYRSDWCDLDTGYTTITDGNGVPHSVYISATRDGSIWMRAGQDHQSLDWSYTTEVHHKLQATLLEQETVNMIMTLNYSDYCVLSDLDLVLRAEAGWHPSYLVAYNPRTKRNQIMIFRHNRECESSTIVTMTPDRQGITCNGGEINFCGVKNLPEKGGHTSTLFLKYAKLDPQGPDSWSCQPPQDKNGYTFLGSYYHVYVRLALCPPPKDSRTLGYEAQLRSERDVKANMIIIPDPTQKALGSGVIKGWQAFAKIISRDHKVYLQVWRPYLEKNTYVLIGQNLFHPTELRFQEVPLHRSEMIRIEKGDVLGLYFPQFNPIAYSMVPCASDNQWHQFVMAPQFVTPGRSFIFQRSRVDDVPCRHYSFTAILANKTDAKLVEDWTCPTLGSRTDTHKRSGKHNKPDTSSGSTGDEAGGGANTRYSNETAVPVHLILIIIGCLIALLLIVGFISYYKAIKS